MVLPIFGIGTMEAIGSSIFQLPYKTLLWDKPRSTSVDGLQDGTPTLLFIIPNPKLDGDQKYSLSSRQIN